MEGNTTVSVPNTVEKLNLPLFETKKRSGITIYYITVQCTYCYSKVRYWQ
jgi:hypothetical protein